MRKSQKPLTYLKIKGGDYRGGMKKFSATWKKFLNKTYFLDSNLKNKLKKKFQGSHRKFLLCEKISGGDYRGGMEKFSVSIS